MKKLNYFILLLLLVFTTGCNNTIVSPIWELPDPTLTDIAINRVDPNWGTVVVYNPDYCEKLGEACGFFRLHAFAHERLNHVLQPEPEYYTVRQENRADCYAAQNGRANETAAAVEFLLDESRHEGIPISGDPETRAENIKKCAIENNRWIG